MKARAITAATIRVCGGQVDLGWCRSAASGSRRRVIGGDYPMGAPARHRPRAGEAIQIVLVNLHDDRRARYPPNRRPSTAADRDALLADRRLRRRQPGHRRRRLPVRRQPAGAGRRGDDRRPLRLPDRGRDLPPGRRPRPRRRRDGGRLLRRAARGLRPGRDRRPGPRPRLDAGLAERELRRAHRRPQQAGGDLRRAHRRRSSWSTSRGRCASPTAPPRACSTPGRSRRR